MGKRPAIERREETEDRTGKRAAFDYAPLPGTADAMVDNKGRVRPVWQHFLSHLSAMPEKDLAERFARADRYLRDAGVFYRAYGSKGTGERAWPISHIPVLIDEREWQTLSAGLVQRADLLEAIVAHLYGDNRLVEGGGPRPGLG